jgi:hypothetical protein
MGAPMLYSLRRTKTMQTRLEQIQNFILGKVFDYFPENGWDEYMKNTELEHPEGFEPLCEYSMENARDLRGKLQADFNELVRFIDNLSYSLEGFDKKEHMDYNNGTCPNCGSENMNYDIEDMEPSEFHIYRKHECKDCGCINEEKYVLETVRKVVE